MIRKVCIILGVILFWSCSTSTKENQNSTTIVPLDKSVGSYISEDIQSAVTSKRRGKLSSLEADGPAWFSFTFNESFEELIIGISSHEFVWKMDDIVDAVDQSGQIKVDVLLTEGDLKVYFNEYISYSFNQSFISSSSKVKVYLDGELKDFPGVLMDIGN